MGRPAISIVDAADKMTIHGRASAENMVDHILALALSLRCSCGVLPEFALIGKNGRRAIKPWELYRNFGRIVTINDRYDATNLRLPSPEDIIATCLRRRQFMLRGLREALADPAGGLKRYLSYFQHVDPSSHAIDKRLVELTGRMTGADLCAEKAAGVWLMNMLELFVRQTFNVWPEEALGAALGRRCEMEFLQTHFPSPLQWTVHVRQILEEHFLPALSEIQRDFGDFALPDPSDEKSSLASVAGKRKGSTPMSMYMPDRISFYMNFDLYNGIRALRGKIKNCYAIFVFSEYESDPNGRYVLDSTLYKNRLFCLRGTLSEVLAVAQLEKPAIRRSPRCEMAPAHDHDGHWRQEIARFLTKA